MLIAKVLPTPLAIKIEPMVTEVGGDVKYLEYKIPPYLGTSRVV